MELTFMEKAILGQSTILLAFLLKDFFLGQKAETKENTRAIFALTSKLGEVSNAMENHKKNIEEIPDIRRRVDRHDYEIEGLKKSR